MLIDKQVEFSDAQVVTASAASTKPVNLGSARDIGMGKQLHVAISVNETPASATSASVLTIQLQKANVEDFSDAEIVSESASYAIGTLSAGDQFFMPIPVGTNGKHLRLYYNVATENLTAGSFSAAVVEGIQKSDIYPGA